MDYKLNADKSKYKVMFRGQNAGRSHNINSDNIKSENIKSENIRSDNIKSDNRKSDNIKSDNIKSDNIKSDNISFERVEEFKYLGTSLTNKNSIQEEIKSRFKSGNACYHSVQTFFVFQFDIQKNIMMKIYRTIILPVALYGCETWSLTLREERRLRVFENRVFRRIFGPMRDEVTGEWRELHNDKLNDLYSSPNIVRMIKSSRMRWEGM